jgi:hypothetical protein
VSQSTRIIQGLVGHTKSFSIKKAIERLAAQEINNLTGIMEDTPDCWAENRE